MVFTTKEASQTPFHKENTVLKWWLSNQNQLETTGLHTDPPNRLISSSCSSSRSLTSLLTLLSVTSPNPPAGDRHQQLDKCLRRILRKSYIFDTQLSLWSLGVYIRALNIILTDAKNLFPVLVSLNLYVVLIKTILDYINSRKIQQ